LLYLYVLFTFAVTFAAVVLLYYLVSSSRTRIRFRLNVIREAQERDEDKEPLSLPFSERILKPAKEKIVAFIGSFTPEYLKTMTEHKLVQGGNPGGLKAAGFLAGVGAAAVVLPVLTLALLLLGGYGLKNSVLLALLMFLLSILAPSLWLSMTAAGRVAQVEKSLPDAIDLLVVSVEAGLAFDMALAKVAERMKGPLAGEFARTLNEMKMGKSRRVALRDLSLRVGSRDLSNFLTMAIQGTQMGITMGRILRIQSDTMRQTRRQRIEEAAMKAPIKMVFPLVFFIFPALFIVILGPAIIQFAKSFKF
jgi:tight adherence protein C